MTREEAKMKIEVDLEDDGTNTVNHTSKLIDEIYDYFGVDMYGALKEVEAQRNAVIIELMPQGKVVYIECKDESLLPELKEIAENIVHEG